MIPVLTNFKVPLAVRFETSYLVSKLLGCAKKYFSTDAEIHGTELISIRRFHLIRTCDVYFKSSLNFVPAYGSTNGSIGNSWIVKFIELIDLGRELGDLKDTERKFQK